MSTLNNSPKFRTVKGDLTAYAFACGYKQWASQDGTELGHWDNGKEMYLDGGMFQVRQFTKGITALWESVYTLAEARKLYRSISI